MFGPDDRGDYDPFVRGKMHELQVAAGKHLLDFKMNNHVQWTGVYEPEVVNVIGHFVEPGDLVIDAGASLGFFTVLLAKIVGDSGIVLAFEPEARSYDLLKRNIEENRLTNTVAFQSGLFRENGV